VLSKLQANIENGTVKVLFSSYIYILPL